MDQMRINEVPINCFKCKAPIQIAYMCQHMQTADEGVSIMIICTKCSVDFLDIFQLGLATSKAIK